MVRKYNHDYRVRMTQLYKQLGFKGGKRQFTVSPAKESSWERVFDPICVVVTIACKVMNAEEMRAVGASSYNCEGGSMDYYYNTVTNCIVGKIGGGTYYFNDQETADRIGTFLKDNPQGGGITHCMIERKMKIS